MEMMMKMMVGNRCGNHQNASHLLSAFIRLMENVRRQCDASRANRDESFHDVALNLSRREFLHTVSLWGHYDYGCVCGHVRSGRRKMKETIKCRSLGITLRHYVLFALLFDEVIATMRLEFVASI